MALAWTMDTDMLVALVDTNAHPKTWPTPGFQVEQLQAK